MKKQTGYTIIELIIVMAIISTIAAAMMSSFTAYKDRARVKAAIRQLVLIQKSINTIAGACRGFPIRDVANINDIDSILPIVDETSCGGAAKTPTTIFPSRYQCQGGSLSSELRESLCKSAPTVEDNNSNNPNFNKMFIALPSGIDACSPNYGAPSGSGYPGNYRPGWNYALLFDSTGIDKPVGVICGTALGHGVVVKVVVNTSGVYSGESISEGSGCRDITGVALVNPCPCGPWCAELSLTGAPTGRQGCCASCNGGGNLSCGVSGFHNGIGYKF